MEELEFFEGKSKNISRISPKKGCVYVCTDTGELYLAVPGDNSNAKLVPIVNAHTRYWQPYTNDEGENV